MLLGSSALAPFAASCSPLSRRLGTGVEPLGYQGLLDVARLIETREITPSALTHSVIDRILAIDGRLKSYATLMDADAMRAAQTADEEIAAGRYLGPLHGIPVAVKDLLYTAGVPTMGGMKVMADFVPDHDATVVRRLREAGAIIVGKLNLAEGAMVGYNPAFQVPVNPWSSAYWTGASSSGSGVATAAGLCFAAIGTDTGGSLRLPAMANGVVGLKPTYGLVSRYGVLPLAESMDHVGPMARRVADVAIMLEAIAGGDPDDETSLMEPVADIMGQLDAGVEGVRIGVDRTWGTGGVDAGLTAAIDAALATLESRGATTVEVDMPWSEQIFEVWTALCAYEAHRAHVATYPSRADEYGPFFRDFLALGAGVSDEQYQSLSGIRADYVERLRAILATVDAVACPAGGVPFEVPAGILYGGMKGWLDFSMGRIQPRFTLPADLAGTPAIALPCGFAGDGLPYTIQLMGDRRTEPMLCRIAHTYEQATDWHLRHPDL